MVGVGGEVLRQQLDGDVPAEVVVVSQRFSTFGIPFFWRCHPRGIPDCRNMPSMPKALEEPHEAHVQKITFHENHIAELRFADGREVVWSGRLCADLRSVIENAVKQGFRRAQRGSSGINTVGN